MAKKINRWEGLLTTESAYKVATFLAKLLDEQNCIVVQVSEHNHYIPFIAQNQMLKYDDHIGSYDKDGKRPKPWFPRLKGEKGIKIFNNGKRVELVISLTSFSVNFLTGSNAPFIRFEEDGVLINNGNPLKIEVTRKYALSEN